MSNDTRKPSIDSTKYFSDHNQPTPKKIGIISTKALSKESYFNNNKGATGFAEPQHINTASGIQIELYTNQLNASKRQQITQDIHATVDKFITTFQLTPNSLGKGEKLKIYLFNNQEDYRHLGEKQFELGLGNEGGKFYYHRDPNDNVSEIYIYQEGAVRNLVHELTHALTYYAAGPETQKIPIVLVEGIAEYFEHNAAANGVALNTTDCKNLTADQIIQLNYSEDSVKNHFVYTVGHALVSYLQEKEPGLIKNYFEKLSNARTDEAKELLDTALKNIDSFKEFVSKNSTKSLIKNSNALEIIPENFIASRKEIIGQDIKTVHYKEAIIKNKSGKTVGAFSPIELIGFHKKIRATNKASNDYIDLPQEYHFLKVIKKKKGYAFTYCDQEGKEYRQSIAYKNKAIQLFAKYNPSIMEDIERAYKKQFEKLEVQSEEINQSYEKAKRDYSNENPEHLYQKIKKNTNFTDTEKILSKLTTINCHHIISRSKIRPNKLLENNRILSMRIDGKGDTSAISVYRPNDKKLGELSAQSGFFKQVEDEEKSSFIFSDGLKNLYTRYDDTAFLGITKTASGNYQADFIEGINRSGDLYFDRRHFNTNDLLRPNVNIITANQLPKVVMEEATPLRRRQDSPAAQYTEEQKRSGIVIAKSELLDDKGSEDTADDVYGAVVQEKGQVLYQFKNIGFYITEKMENNDSALFIQDHGSNKRFQLPNAITHLKLVEINQQVKLVPCDKDGNESPEGMPEDIGDYRYIDPIFAHTYAKKDYSTQHSNEGPIDFSQYHSGHLFAIQYDPNDTAIRRDPQGNILRVRPDQAYFTKVKLFDGDKAIGMLSNDFSNFKGEIFLSVDYNYSYTDFLASVSPTVKIEKFPDGRTKITFGQSVGDVGGTDHGYTDHQRFYSTKTTDTVIPKLISTLSAHTTHERTGNFVQGPSSDRPSVFQPDLITHSRGRA